jgi:hypothetical protein
MKKILCGIALMLICLPAAAVEHEVYGSIGNGAWWTNSERFYADTSQDSTVNATYKDSVPIMNGNILPYGTLGVRFTKGQFAGCIEMGAILGVYDFTMKGNVTEMFMGQKKTLLLTAKRWFATWAPSERFTFLLGRDYTPANFFPSNQAFWKENSFNNIGCLYTGRTPMFQISLHDKDLKKELKIAMVQTDTSCFAYNGRPSGLEWNYKYYCENPIPKAEGSFEIQAGTGSLAFRAKAAGGYETYKSVLITATTTDPGMGQQLNAKTSKVSLDAWVGGVDLGVKLFNRLSLACDLFYGKNPAIYGVYVGNDITWWKISDFLRPFGPQVTLDGDTVNVDNGYAFEISGIANVALTGAISLEAGGGTIRGRHEYEPYMDQWNPTYAWYFQTDFKLGGSLKLVPEVGQYIYGPHLGFGRISYVGLNARVDFN